MTDMIKDDSKGFSRREFIKITGGIGAMAILGPQMAFAANPGARSMADVKQNRMETDVLVVGGGIAGAFAAVKACEMDAQVTVVVKGSVGRSGLTPGANTFFIYDPSLGDDYDAYIKQFLSSGEYLNNRNWTEKIIRESRKTYDEFSSWGVLTGRKDCFMPGTFTRSFEVVEFGDPMRKKIQEVGVNLIERAMITDLLLQDGRVKGAVGFSLDDEELYVIEAKAVCLCAGAGSFKPMGHFPCNSVTHDGDGMAYRIGAEISGKEFNDPHELFTGGLPPRPVFRGKDKIGRSGPLGSPIPGTGFGGAKVDIDKDPIGFTLKPVFQAMRGEIPAESGFGPPPGKRPPGGGPPGGGPPGGGPQGAGPPGLPTPEPSSYFPNSRMQSVIGATAGMSNHKGEGLWPKDTSGVSNIPGLFAAGDNLCSMQNGANYAGFGTSFCGSAVQGATVGISAAEYAKSEGKISIKGPTVGNALEAMTAPRQREKGFSPSWLTRAMQGIMLPFYVLYAKEESRLQSALSNILYLKSHIAPLMTARDPHELRLAHETSNMLLNAEMKLRASIMRKESRGTHFREDYPARDDRNWLAWIKIRQDHGNMVLEKQDMPRAWRPDMSISYERRYPKRFPGEMEFLRKNV